MEKDKEGAVVIRINGRYFYGFGKAGQVKTAWCIVGALMFFAGSVSLEDVMQRLRQKGKNPEAVLVRVVE